MVAFAFCLGMVHRAFLMVSGVDWVLYLHCGMSRHGMTQHRLFCNRGFLETIPFRLLYDYVLNIYASILRSPCISSPWPLK